MSDDLPAVPCGPQETEESPAVRLTRTAKRAGCAAKHPPGFLLPLVGALPRSVDPNVLVGSATADDAAVYRLDDERALVLTTDFFTPIVDRPYDFGAIAAANALSDIYAMGGTPLCALNIVGFPDADSPARAGGAAESAGLDASVLGEILRGGAEKAREAGIEIVGGHTIKTDEPIYGLSVTGMVHPARIVTNARGRPGDLLVLTKPLGLGIITTAAKQDRDDEGAIAEAIRVMATLNRSASDAMSTVPVHACTDVTGFGLLGHLRNLATASECSAVVWVDAVPVLAAAWRYVRAGVAPGGTHANWRFLQDWATYAADVAKDAQLVLSDAQTSGGLLIAVSPDDVDALLDALRRRGTLAAAVVGELEGGPPGRMRVLAARLPAATKAG